MAVPYETPNNWVEPQQVVVIHEVIKKGRVLRVKLNCIVWKHRLLNSVSTAFLHCSMNLSREKKTTEKRRTTKSEKRRAQ